MTSKTAKQGTDKTAKAVEDFTAAGQEAVQTFVQASVDGYGKVFETARERAEELAKGYDKFAFGGKENVEALVKAGNAYAKGMEALNAEFMSFTKQMVEDNVSATRKVMGAKTLQEMMDLQAEYARTSLDGIMAEGTKMGELAAKVAQEISEPINSRVTAVVEQFAKPAA